MKKLLQKLRSKAGESLIESLAAILVFTMSSIILYSLVTTAADLNSRVRELDRQNQADMVAVEQGSGTSSKGTVTFKIDSTTITVNVDVYGEPEGYQAYFKQPEG